MFLHVQYMHADFVMSRVVTMMQKSKLFSGALIDLVLE